MFGNIPLGAGRGRRRLAAQALADLENFMRRMFPVDAFGRAGAQQSLVIVGSDFVADVNEEGEARDFFRQSDKEAHVRTPFLGRRRENDILAAGLERRFSCRRLQRSRMANLVSELLQKFAERDDSRISGVRVDDAGDHGLRFEGSQLMGADEEISSPVIEVFGVGRAMSAKWSRPPRKK